MTRLFDTFSSPLLSSPARISFLFCDICEIFLRLWEILGGEFLGGEGATADIVRASSSVARERNGFSGSKKWVVEIFFFTLPCASFLGFYRSILRSEPH